MSASKYFMKTERSFVACDDGSSPLSVGEGVLPERSVNVKEAQGTKTTQVNAHMAAADHDRQGQAAHRQYKSRIIVFLWQAFCNKIRCKSCIIDTQ